MINQLPIAQFVVIGSCAMNTRFAKDVDLVCYKKDVQTEWLEKDNFSGHFNFQGRRVELLFADDQPSFQYILNRGLKKRLATVEELYAIKKAHIMRPSRNFEKHISDISVLKRMIKYVDTELLKLHKQSTEFRLGKQKTPRLNNVTKAKFFDDKVIKFIEHDDLHILFSYTGRPMYEKMQKNDGTVTCYKELWNKFTHEEKIMCVQEEMMVIAVERQLLPTINGLAIGLNPKDALKWALIRICTNLCSGFFRDFAIDNYFEILNSVNLNYYKKLERLK